MNTKICQCFLLTTMLLLTYPFSAMAATEAEVDALVQKLERALEEVKRERAAMAREREALAKEREQIAKAVKAVPKKDENVNVEVYGRFWPRVTYRDEDSEGGQSSGSSTDITDALSRVGIAADSKVSDSVTAFLKGEWDVDIEDDGDFGDARLAYVGVESDSLGRVAIGKQWAPYFNVVAEVTDIYYHRASPFGYDNQGPFRVNNLVTYSNSFGGFKVDLGAQFDGDPVRPNGGSQGGGGGPTQPNHVDTFDIGAGYKFDIGYLGVSHRIENGDNDIDRKFIGVGGSIKPSDASYLAFTYQDIEQELDFGSDQNRHTLDVAFSYAFGHGYSGIVGYYDVDLDLDGPGGTDELDGYNLTLIKKLNNNSSVFAELLTGDFSGQSTNADFYTFSLGIRYDFAATLF